MTAFSDFIRNASKEEKQKVYDKVIKKSCLAQRIDKRVKLNETQVRIIRHLHAQKFFSIRKIALMYNTSRYNVWKIINRKTWKKLA